MNVAVVGAQWGDEGKGKVVDLYGEKAAFIVRYQGGNNAGHTLVVDGKKTVLHIIPSGVLQPGKICLIANGVVFDPNVFFEEVDSLTDAGLFKKAKPEEIIQVSERAHVILPYHQTMDKLRETHAGKGKGKIGTTSRGVGPAYEDKASRRGIQVVDLLHPNLLREKLTRALEEKNVLIQKLYDGTAIEMEPIYQECLKLGERLRPFISNVRLTLLNALKSNQPILFEGAQGTLLDLDHGTYPYVTSSSAVAGGVLAGCGLGPGSVNRVVGITKAYTTRVGTGPFPSEIEDTESQVAKKIRDVGAEYGATTGRPRRVGWLDLVALKYAVEVNGITGIALMKSDVLDNFDTVRVCTSYRLNDRPLDELPSCVEDLENVEPVYEDFSGWKKFDTTAIKSRESLPAELQTYMKRIEEFLSVPIVLLSTGPGREETIQLMDPFNPSARLDGGLVH